MSRRRKPRTPGTSTTPPNDGTPLGGVSDADLLREVARRRLSSGSFEIDAIEELARSAQRDLGEETLAAAHAALPPEDDQPKACPKCRQLVTVKAKNRLRHILTKAGELRLTRNYHYCSHCGRGFAPRDAELNLPEEGEVSSKMKRRILDFGINDTFESVAERWSIHFPSSISSNLVRIETLEMSVDAPERAAIWCPSARAQVDDDPPLRQRAERERFHAAGIIAGMSARRMRRASLGRTSAAHRGTSARACPSAS